MKTSFLISAYNEEKNIGNCINSILNQDKLGDFEIVVVNDGSKDDTGKIVKNYCKNDKRIKLIDLKKNKGRGNARYLGVKNARGKYLAFIDADIILPSNWLQTCLSYMKEYDAVGGIAIPDGDIVFIHNKFKLQPRILEHTTETTGSNSIFKRRVLDKVRINYHLKGGYDTDLNFRMKREGFRVRLAKDLFVQHKENINFKGSLRRMITFGEGATGLLIKYKKIRMADLSFFIFVLLFLFNLISINYYNLYYISAFLLYPLLSSFLHLKTKFKVNKFLFVPAIFVNYVFMIFYYLGRIKGFFNFR